MGDILGNKLGRKLDTMKNFRCFKVEVIISLLIRTAYFSGLKSPKK